MPNFLENVDFLENLFAGMLVPKLAQLYHFDGYELSSQFLDCQVDLTKSPVANLLDKMIEVQTCGRELVVLAHILAVVLDDLIPLLHYFVVQLLMLSSVQVFLSFVDRSRPGSLSGSRASPRLLNWFIGLLPLVDSIRSIICLSSAVIRASACTHLGALILSEQLFHPVSRLFLMRPPSPLLGLLHQ